MLWVIRWRYGSFFWRRRRLPPVLDIFSLSPLLPFRPLHMLQTRTSVGGFDERHRGACWRRIGLPAFRSRISPSAREFSLFVRRHHRQFLLGLSPYSAGA